MMPGIAVADDSQFLVYMSLPTLSRCVRYVRAGVYFRNHAKAVCFRL